MTSSEFIQKFVIHQARILQSHNSYLASVTTLTIGLEIMGGFFDKKPLKSPKQSKLRFRIATDKLLGGKYSGINRDDYLYETLRNQLLHSLLPGRAIVFNIKDNEQHLQHIDTSVIFCPKVFFEDVEKAALKLEKFISEGKAFEKRIPDNSHEIMNLIG